MCDFLKVGLWRLSSAHVSTEPGMSGHTNRLDTDCWKVARWGIQCLPTPGRYLLRQMYQDSSIQQAAPISHCMTHTLLRSHLVPSEGQSTHILLTWAFLTRYLLTCSMQQVSDLERVPLFMSWSPCFLEQLVERQVVVQQ